MINTYRMGTLIARYHNIVLIIILFSGLLLRLYGIDSGLPYIYEPDESIMVDRAVIMLSDLDPNPRWFGWPGTTAIYMLCLLYSFIFLGGLCLGVFGNAGDFSILFHQDPTLFYLSGRIMFMIFGVAAIYITYLITRRIFNRDTGLVAAAFVALCPVHVGFSKMVRPDILVTFLILAAFWFCIDILRRQIWSSYILAGIFTGLAVATKYPAVIIVSTIIMAHILSKRRQWWADRSKLIVSGVTAVLVAFISSPFMFLDYRTVISNYIHETRERNLSATGEGFFQNIVWYLQVPMLDSFSICGIILAGVGIVICIISKKNSQWLLIVFPVLFMIFITSLNLRWTRWIVPLVPFVSVFVAHAFYCTVKYVGDRSDLRKVKWARIFLLLVIFVPLLKSSFLQGREMSGTNTRTLAREWILDNIPKGSSILIEKYTPHLPKDFFTFLEVEKDGRIVKVDTTNIEEAIYCPSWRYIGNLKNVKDIYSQNIEFMVLGEYYDRYLAESERFPEYAEIVDNYQRLMEMGEQIYEVKRAIGRNAGPTVRIYRFDKVLIN